jgi:polyketide biosynthesis enoyl-CoA hydratase PksH
MDVVGVDTGLETLKVHFQDDVCFVQMHRPEANNTINDLLIAEFNQLLDLHEARIRILVLEGLPEVFCFGADFKALEQDIVRGGDGPLFDPAPMYGLWLRLVMGPFVSVAHVRGAANAGGIGFVAACDIVLCDETASFSLSELLFGLMPACVLPFLIRRIGPAKANTMTLLTEPVSAQTALDWGLVDDLAADSVNLLRRKLLRLRRLPASGIRRYKRYMEGWGEDLVAARSRALAANVEVFSDPENRAKIARYVTTGAFPWEAQ